MLGIERGETFGEALDLVMLGTELFAPAGYTESRGKIHRSRNRLRAARTGPSASLPVELSQGMQLEDPRWHVSHFNPLKIYGPDYIIFKISLSNTPYLCSNVFFKKLL